MGWLKFLPLCRRRTQSPHGPRKRVTGVEVLQTFPLAHGAVRANLPLTGVYVGGEINAIEYDGSGMRDFDAHIGWQSDFLLGVKAGYSRLEVELDDVSGLDSDLEIGGPYLAATFRF